MERGDKRGQGLSTNAIILIILGVIVLVVLILGFVLGWDRIAPWIKPSNNVKDISDMCSVACSTQAKFSYCSEKRELKADVTIESATCDYLANKETSYGIAKCSVITCDQKYDCASAGAGNEIIRKTGDDKNFKLESFTCP